MGKFTVDLEVQTANHKVLEELCQILKGHTDFTELMKEISEEAIKDKINEYKAFKKRFEILKKENKEIKKEKKQIQEKLNNIKDTLGV